MSEWNSAEEAFKLRREFSDVSEVDGFIRSFETRYAGGYQEGRYGNYTLPGKGSKTNDDCGTFPSLKVCNRLDLHNKVSLDGVNYAGKVYVHPVFHTCHRPSCPVCFLRGWAVRESHNIEARLKEGSKRYGMAYHIVVSVPVSDYNVSLEDIKEGSSWFA